MRTLPSLVAISAAVFAGSLIQSAHAQDWHKISSADGKASVLFPVPLDENKVMTTVDKTPAGKATTRILEYQDEGMLFTISSTQLPGLAVALASEKKILDTTKDSILAKAFSDEKKYYQYDGLKKPKVMILNYESANLQEKDHPGYDGFAVLFMIGKKLYVVNSMLEKGTDDATKAKNEAAQEKLLRSIAIDL